MAFEYDDNLEELWKEIRFGLPVPRLKNIALVMKS